MSSENWEFLEQTGAAFNAEFGARLTLFPARMALNLRLDQQGLHYGLRITPLAHQPENENDLLSRQPVNMGSLKDLIDYRTRDRDPIERDVVGRFWDVGQVNLIGYIHRLVVDVTLDVVDTIARPLKRLPRNIGAVCVSAGCLRES